METAFCYVMVQTIAVHCGSHSAHILLPVTSLAMQDWHISTHCYGKLRFHFSVLDFYINL
jgi:hypothetical protein